MGTVKELIDASNEIIDALRELDAQAWTDSPLLRATIRIKEVVKQAEAEAVWQEGW